MSTKLLRPLLNNKRAMRTASRMWCATYSTSSTDSPVRVQYVSVNAPSFADAELTDTPPADGSGSIAIVTLNRLKAKNSISRQLLDDLHTAVTRDYAGQGTRALILRSAAPDIFCAGADLKERKTFTQDDTRAFLAKLNHTLDLLETQAVPTIAAIDGVALGGGLELALAADFRVLGPSAVVGLPETRLAIIPGAGGTYRLPRLVGTSRALDLVLTGRRVGAAEALQLGVASRALVNSGESADEGAWALAREIGAGGPVALVAAKQAVRGAAPAWEAGMYARVVNTEDKFEALAAFAEKRKPVFKGR
ncbi:uncharacterized protein SAPINGB_P003408 [Magnusiomyces paraingens]|uniref:Enoyl-CoA hydratase n=1 Tax=Magnusiomyces paraingens TaxID=2606893 RepID=A0A5E8BRK5_9ASCO|nr:uncharacterized protein SAPINGB_P003408 [Saprochaete ingens]VVT53109.1 unnamed protein product [Saprochaete ingens]